MARRELNFKYDKFGTCFNSTFKSGCSSKKENIHEIVQFDELR